MSQGAVKTPLSSGFLKLNAAQFAYQDHGQKNDAVKPSEQDVAPTQENAAGTKDLADCEMYYSLTKGDREAFRTSSGKKVTPFAFDVYDFTRTIPPGSVCTYKHVAEKIGRGSGGSRAVGSALAINPFAPFVPCHRVVAVDGTLGGFMGERAAGEGPWCAKKAEMLKTEGVRVDRRRVGKEFML